MQARALAYCGVFGAAALLLPTIFHLAHLGHVFMPMYLPLVTLAFLTTPLAAALTALCVPLLSAFATGMPPLNPPIAIVMSLELATLSAIIAATPPRLRQSRRQILALLIITLSLGRILYALLLYHLSKLYGLQPAPLALASLLGGWPGIILMLLVIPQIVRRSREIQTAA